MDIPPAELQERLEKLGTNDSNIINETEDLQNSSRPITSDVTTDTDDFRRNGQFVNSRRGGRSEEGSFQKQMLSPSSLPPIDESELPVDGSPQDSSEKQLPKIRKMRTSNELLEPPVNLRSPPIEPTPHPSPTKSTNKNQKLLRRLSQYEDRGSDPELDVPPTDPLPKIVVCRKSASQGDSVVLALATWTVFGSVRMSRLNRMGQSYATMNFDSDDYDDDENLALPVLDPKSQTSFRFRLDSSPDIKEEVDRRHSASHGEIAARHPAKLSSCRSKDTCNATTASSSKHPRLASGIVSKRDEAPFAESDFTSNDRARLLQQQKIAMIQAELDLANSDMPLGASPKSQDSRKPSVTTQDFLDEAKKIMAGIRGKARPHSGLSSLEESETEMDRALPSNSGADDESEDSYQESTRELFERPPSREGAPVSRAPFIQDPELLDHLRKYEENSETDGVVASSIKSMAMAKEVTENQRDIDKMTNETTSKSSSHFFDLANTVQSEPPNIRISNNPDIQRKRKHSGSSRQMDEEYDDPDFFTQGSNNSIPTTSSKRLGFEACNCPAYSIAFDSRATCWHGENDGQDSPNSEGTEEDPFEDIPDLSFDETQELTRLRAIAAKQKEDAHLRLAEYLDEEGQHDAFDGRSPPKNTSNMSLPPVDSRPQSAPSKPIQRDPDNSLPEIKIRSASEGEDNALRPKKTRNRDPNKPIYGSHSSAGSKVPEGSRESVDEDVFNQADEDLSTTTPKRQRNVTITSTQEGACPSDYDSADESGTEDDDGSIHVRKGKSRQGSGPRGGYRNTSRRLSVRGQQFVPRPVSRIDERDEDSADRESVVMNKTRNNPLPTPSVSPRRVNSVVLATPRPAHEIGTLELTPLSEFTMHQADESYGLDVSYVANGSKHVPEVSTKKTLSHSIREMVEKLTEIEPYEPFWEHMKSADLHRKKLKNLHKLDEFCEHLEELQVSKNEISQLNGVPSSLRHLVISHNRLSDLTSWGHLWNLQQVNVSNNEIESLSCFRNLVHLRSLHADNNKITSLHGIGGLDGLITLRLRGNPIETVDFEGTNLKHLENLDLRECQISEIKNIGHLPKLSSLDLENNNLVNFMAPDDTCSAREIRLSFNNLESFDASLTPEIRVLYLDANRIKTISGLLHKRNLYSLSVREQQSGTILDKSFLHDAFEVRKLFLSGNYLGTFDPGVEYLNLQYLELANCGITSLPDDFGLMVSNVRVLNLNFNALQEFQCLLGIVRLKKLLLAGNRLTKVERITRTLRAFPYLTTVDMRNNHVNHNFYPIALERCLIKDGGLERNELDVIDPYSLGNADPVRDAHYISCSDMGTKSMRRVYEMLVFGKKSDNPRLQKLDGLPVNREVSKIRDDVWEKLVEMGYIKKTEKTHAKTNNGQADDASVEENQEHGGCSHQDTAKSDLVEGVVENKVDGTQQCQSNGNETREDAQCPQDMKFADTNVDRAERTAERSLMQIILVTRTRGPKST
ncbi:hypothetical protein EYC84_009504 [Monilinia fructicola]|uniref:Uncharacterized protein n=1 Tax=Monilinia fructicola TaxID=38448 RepID=A0A5M9JBB4_MONFR|nr:hypothetical protein EYC84_009504 [Monilinia fructicola]